MAKFNYTTWKKYGEDPYDGTFELRTPIAVKVSTDDASRYLNHLNHEELAEDCNYNSLIYDSFNKGLDSCESFRNAPEQIKRECKSIVSNSDLDDSRKYEF